MTTTVAPEIMDSNIQKLREEIERRTGKTPEQLYEEREKRVREAIELKEPDRVPMTTNPDPSLRHGLPHSAAYYDPVAWKEAIRKDTLYFEPDLGHAGFSNSGSTWEALGVKNRMWPGGTLPPDLPYQFVEGEYMKAEEYDHFLQDPGDFIVRAFLPRIYENLAPLSKLPPLSLMFTGFDGVTAMFATPEFEQLARTLSKAGKELQNHRKATGNATEELALLGFPAFSNSEGAVAGGAPFDAISSNLRGLKGTTLDMYQRPEKLLRACDMLADMRIARAVPADPGKRGNPKRAGMPLWRGDKMFMSQKQFETFYWPGLKKVMQASIDLGYIPMPFFEAHFGDRLECLLDLPKGKVIACVEHMDAVRAKEILKGHHCILSGGPLSLKKCSIPEVEEYTKDLIKSCGKDGGFILRMRLPDEGRPEDIKGMVESIKEYSRY